MLRFGEYLLTAGAPAGGQHHRVACVTVVLLLSTVRGLADRAHAAELRRWMRAPPASSILHILTNGVLLMLVQPSRCDREPTRPLHYERRLKDQSGAFHEVRRAVCIGASRAHLFHAFKPVSFTGAGFAGERTSAAVPYPSAQTSTYNHVGTGLRHKGTTTSSSAAPPSCLWVSDHGSRARAAHHTADTGGECMCARVCCRQTQRQPSPPWQQQIKQQTLSRLPCRCMHTCAEAGGEL